MKSTLDDTNLIANLDPDGALDVARQSFKQLDVSFPSYELKTPRNVVFAGMGGSALAAVMAKSWLKDELSVPFEYVRDYDLPAYVDEDTLVITSSYSGNTEETLSCFEQAQKAHAQIVVLTRGGRLKELAQEHDLPLYQLPDVSQPRFSTTAGLLATVEILEAAGLVQGKVEELRGQNEFMRKVAERWTQNVPAEQNRAKQLALELAGKSVVVWGGPRMSALAYKWKISVNENAKNVAFWNEWPEFNHNEFVGWSSHPVEKVYGVVELVSAFEHTRIKQRYEVSNRLLSGKMPAPTIIEAEGDTLLQEILYFMLLGDFMSLYLAIVNGNNPTPVKLVEKLKTELNKLD